VVARPKVILDIATLYRYHGKHIYNLAYYYLHSIVEAEEVTQDVFLKAYDHRDRFRGEAEWHTYLYRIAVNACLDILRKKKRRAAIIKWIPWSSSFSHEFDTGEELGSEQADAQWKWLLHAIGELPETQRTAFILMKIESKSQKETAEIMQLSPKAVESLVQRAKSTLIKKSKFFEGI
jgi:RNA polymerase sigma factor (sigma-70 family)